MKPLATKLRPAGGFSRVVHLFLLAALPLLVYVLVSAGFAPAALAVVLLSKWRMFAVKPRFWAAHLRTNSVDIMVGLSLLAFMTATDSQTWRLIWMGFYILWLTVIKPSSRMLVVALQAIVGFSLGLVALYLIGGDAPLFVLVFGTGFICYAGAHHYFDAFNERFARLLSYTWAWFGASLAWVLGHWLLYYGDTLVAQPVLLLVSLGYGLGALYYLDHQDRLTTLIGRQFVFIMVAITIIVLTLSDWGDKIV
jgi:hypothetical protein